tara:strand:+ start:5749 stop:6795 length:1047 start_codon:yes stop_codon:yes gene_type:complete
MSITASEMIQGEITRKSNEISSHTTPDMLKETLRELKAQQSAEEPAPAAEEPAPAAEEEAAPAAEEAAPAAEEAAPEEEVAPDPVMADKFAKLARKERSLRQREAELNAKMSKKEPTPAKEAPKKPASKAELERLAVMAKDNPLELLQEYGLTYADVANAMARDPDPGKYSKPKEKKQGEFSPEIDSRIQELETKINEQSRQADLKQYETSMAAFLDEIQNFVDNSSGKYELIQSSGDYALVAEVMQRNHQETGKVMPYEKAASQVEELLYGRFKPFAGSKKIAELFQPKVEAKTEPSQPGNRGKSKTLTQEASARQAKASGDEPPESMTREQSLAWIARNFNVWGGE